MSLIMCLESAVVCNAHHA